ncbi:hypothetical protein HY641_01875 [Candidatus Woesearchaeota archaeon]|nr:hypothetical protein [Candidatus Woesearchaeota archaeon]
MAKRPQDKFTKDSDLEDKKSKDDEELKMHLGEEDKDIYNEDGAEELREDDEIDDWEEGFMEGASGMGKGPFCAHCGEELSDSKKCVEQIINGKHVTFCGDACASKGLRS